MTNEQAIEELKSIRSGYDIGLLNAPEIVKDTVTALDMAIEALQRGLCKKIAEESGMVEVVRCRDCKYAEENWNGKDIYCLRTSSFPWSNDSFCSDGERKDGEAE